jgi:hypothetical protein
LSVYSSSIITREERSGGSGGAKKSILGSMGSMLSGGGNKPQELNPGIERDGSLSFPFLVAQLDWNPSDMEHLNMMRAIYQVLLLELWRCYGGGILLLKDAQYPFVAKQKLMRCNYVIKIKR